MDVLQHIHSALIEREISVVVELTQRALEENINPEEIIKKSYIPAMQVVGERFQRNEIYVPEMLLSAKAMKEGMNILKALIVSDNLESAGKVVLGTISGDLHDIGKNLVGTMLEGSGFKVIDMGVNVSPEKYISAVKENNADVVGFSALLTTTMSNMAGTIEAFEKAGIRNRVKIIVGGAPVTEDFAQRIGADGYAVDAPEAVKVVKQLIGKDI